MNRRSFMRLGALFVPLPYVPERVYSFLWAPKHFGGLGGVVGGREFDPSDLFEAAVRRRFGSALVAEPAGGGLMGDGVGVGAEIWSALANQDWRHMAGHTASYSFRAAGDLIAAARGSGDYIDWYCSGPYSTVTDRVRAAMKAEGWEPCAELSDDDLGYPSLGLT
jgi:hypothetical protein